MSQHPNLVADQQTSRQHNHHVSHLLSLLVAQLLSLQMCHRGSPFPVQVLSQVGSLVVNPVVYHLFILVYAPRIFLLVNLYRCPHFYQLVFLLVYQHHSL